jgi:hypothetical protein
MKQINVWLTDRLERSLSPYQLTCLSFMVKVWPHTPPPAHEPSHPVQKLYTDWQLHGIDDDTLNCKPYVSVCKRVQLEEANAALAGDGQL